MKDKIKDVIKFLIALLFVIFILFLNLAYAAFIIVISKWILEFFIPDIGWKIPILSYVAGYLGRKFILKVVKRK